MVGATQQHGLSSEQALQELGRRVTDPGEAAAAADQLLPAAAEVWPAVAQMAVQQVRWVLGSGV